VNHAFRPALCAIVDVSPGSALQPERIAEALTGGVSLLQIRGKFMTPRSLVLLVRRLLPLCRDRGVPLLVNDRPDVAAAAGAGGVHLGQGDVPAAAVRRLHPDWIIGLSVHNRGELEIAESAGAYYVAAGSLYPTGSKNDAVLLDHGSFRDLCRSARLPVLGIGGITVERTGDVIDLGACGVAVISGLWSAEDPRGRAAEYAAAVQRMRSSL
jgi:thiamine-phosphate diphosphorylase